MMSRELAVPQSAEVEQYAAGVDEGPRVRDFIGFDQSAFSGGTCQVDMKVEQRQENRTYRPDGSLSEERITETREMFYK